MKTYVVSLLSDRHYRILSKVIYANDEREALLQGSYELLYEDLGDPVTDHWSDDKSRFYASMADLTIEQIKYDMAGADRLANVIEVPMVKP